MRKLIILFFLLASKIGFSQVNGGEYIFNFLSLSQNPHTTALGGVSVSNPSHDLMLSTGNPALLQPSYHTSLGINTNFYYAKSKVSNILYAHYDEKINTTFSVGLQYMDYGKFDMTDNIGNSYGTFLANEYAFSVSASKQYLNHWRYGATLKLANSHLVSNSRFWEKKATALVSDLGIAYADTVSKWYFGAVIKNAGFMIRNYQQGYNQPLPLDLQIGVTKKFKRAPFSISVLANHLTKWDIRYNNPADITTNTLLFNDSSTTTKTKTYFADKLFRHFVFALDVNLGKRIELSAGYNHLRRSELSISDKKGMSGFSLGIGVYLNKFIIHFAQSYYHLAGPYNEVGITMKLNQLFGLGNSINWSDKFANTF